MLIAAGASLLIEDHAGLSPRQLAIMAEDHELSEYLESQEEFQAEKLMSGGTKIQDYETPVWKERNRRRYTRVNYRPQVAFNTFFEISWRRTNLLSEHIFFNKQLSVIMITKKWNNFFVSNSIVPFGRFSTSKDNQHFSGPNLAKKIV